MLRRHGSQRADIKHVSMRSSGRFAEDEFNEKQASTIGVHAAAASMLHTLRTHAHWPVEDTLLGDYLLPTVLVWFQEERLGCRTLSPSTCARAGRGIVDANEDTWLSCVIRH
eukprot:2705733-Amphidinium_carterae.1